MWTAMMLWCAVNTTTLAVEGCEVRINYEEFFETSKMCYADLNNTMRAAAPEIQQLAEEGVVLKEIKCVKWKTTIGDQAL